MKRENLILIRDEKYDLISYLADKEYIAFDTETTGVHHEAEVIGISVCAEDDKAFYLIIQEWKDGKLVRNISKNHVAKLLESIKGKSLIMHNGIFDCLRCELNFNVKLIDSLHTDTMVLAHLLDENNPVGLKDLAAQHFGEDSRKEQREMKENVIKNGGQYSEENKEIYKADSDVLGKYGAKDAILTYNLFLALVPDLYKQGLEKFFYEEESMPLLKGPTYDLNSIGLKVDQNKLIETKNILITECEAAKAFILAEIHNRIKDKYPGDKKKNQFNISAPQQLSWLLFYQYKLEFGTLTKEGKKVCKGLGMNLPYSAIAKEEFMYKCINHKGNIYEPEGIINGKVKKAKTIKDPWVYISCDDEILEKYSNKYKWVKSLLEYRKKQKLISTYLIGLEERIQYGIIRPSFLQTGTTSGRYSSKNPNFQNLPRDDKRVKSCIISRPGKVFIGADYSQLEPRVFAYFSGDGRLLKTFRSKDDFYSVVGMEIYDKKDCTPQKEGSKEAFGVKYKNLRQASKEIALAAVYGASAWRLMPLIGKNKAETQKDIDNYFKAFPEVKKFMINSRNEIKKHGKVKNLFGRFRRIPEATIVDKEYQGIDHEQLPYNIRSKLNLSTNFIIQSTAASIVNRSMILFYNNIKQLRIDAKIVCQVHDSIVVECAEESAGIVSILLQDAMENAVKLNTIDLEAKPIQGKTLAEV